MAFCREGPTIRRSVLDTFGIDRRFRPLESRSPAASGTGARRTRVETSICSASPPPTSTSIMIEEVAAVKVSSRSKETRRSLAPGRRGGRRPAASPRCQCHAG